MTERTNALTVVLDQAYSHDDIERLVSAIKLFEGVLDVVPNTVTSEDYFAEIRAKNKLRLAIWDVIKPRSLDLD